MATCTAQLVKPIPPLPFPRQYIDMVDLTMGDKANTPISVHLQKIFIHLCSNLFHYGQYTLSPI